jgi:hypothetical protein
MPFLKPSLWWAYLLHFTAFSQGRQGNQKTPQTFFTFLLFKLSGNIRTKQRIKIK